jgi:hypothetical protein
MKKKSLRAERLSRQSRQDEINNETLNQAGMPQPTMLKASSELLAELRSKGRSKNLPDSDFDPEQLKMGIVVEMEHGLGKEAAKEIAKDHLDEMSDYYTRLKKMEAKKSLPEHRLVVLIKAKYISRKRVNGKWVYKYGASGKKRSDYFSPAQSNAYNHFGPPRKVDEEKLGRQPASNVLNPNQESTVDQMRRHNEPYEVYSAAGVTHPNASDYNPKGSAYVHFPNRSRGSRLFHLEGGKSGGWSRIGQEGNLLSHLKGGKKPSLHSANHSTPDRVQRKDRNDYKNWNLNG